MKKKILITGANGMLAHDFKKEAKELYSIISYDRDSLDICNYHGTLEIISQEKPDIVLNCAAYTAVDDAEDIGMKKNYEVNAIGVYNLAKITQKNGIYFITISTDYVFDGENENGYSEIDTTRPINQYGMAKYLGEQLAMSENKNTIVVRTSWLYGGGIEFKNFVNTMLSLSEKHSSLKVVNDQYGIPTSTSDLGSAIISLIENINTYKGSVLHLSNRSSNEISWADFAKEIFRIVNKTTLVKGCNSDEYPTKALRPNYSMLLNNSGIILPDWKDGLKKYLSSL